MQTVATTDDVPAGERFGYWHDLVWNGFAPMELTTDRADRFYASQRLLRLGDVDVWEAVCSSSESRRASRLIRQSDPETYCLHIPVSGRIFAETAGHSVLCGPGDIYSMDTSHTGRTVMRGPDEEGPYRVVAAVLPRAGLPFSAGRLDRATGVRMNGRDGVGSLLSTMLSRLIEESGTLTATDAPRVGTVVRDLFIAVLAQRMEAEADAPEESRRSVLALQVREFILRHLTDRDLAPARIAAAHHISLSYLHRVFREEQGSTVNRWIRAQRLEHARRDLADPACRDLTVHEIAAHWGFAHAADFSRAFRAAHGMSPTEFRHRPGRTDSAAHPRER